MKKLILGILLTLFSVTALAAPPPFTTEGTYPARDITAHGNFIMEDNGIEGEIITGTTGILVLYVDPAGDDSGTCLAAGAGACATIQSAIDRVPKYVNHNVTIFVNSGTYATAYIGGFTIRNNADFTIRGVLINSTTLATGTATGTATGGSTTQCTDAGQTWTGDDVIGKLVYLVGSNQYRLIYDNDGTNLYFREPASGTCSGQDYQIKDWSTFLQGVEPYGALGPITVDNNDAGRGEIILSNLASINGETIAFLISHTDGPKIERCYAYNNVYGYWNQSAMKSLKIYDSYSESASFSGFGAARSSGNIDILGCLSKDDAEGYHIESSMGYVEIEYSVSLAATSAGILLKGVTPKGSIKGHMSDGDNYGISFSSSASNVNIAMNSAVVIWGGTDISNATTGGIVINQGYAILNAVTGTANAGYGVDVRMGSQVIVNSSTTITGATSDLTINEGATNLTWAAEFAADGDIVVNLDSLARIERRD